VGHKVEGETHVNRSFRCPISSDDFLCEKAKERGETLSEFIRRLIYAEKLKYGKSIEEEK